jgi:hypothetical protein
MRLAILDNGHRFRTKGLFAVIRAVSRLPVPDAVKTNRYRPDFYGMPMGVLTQKAMRGPAAWSVGDREMMGACVSQINECHVCTKTHAGVAALAYYDERRGRPCRSRDRAARRAAQRHHSLAAQADARTHGGCRRHTGGSGVRCVARADRGRAGGRLRFQDSRSPLAHLRVGRGGAKSVRGGAKFLLARGYR